MVECIAEYTNDPISVDQRDPDKFDSGRYMFEKLNDEGHDARFLDGYCNSRLMIPPRTLPDVS